MLLQTTQTNHPEKTVPVEIWAERNGWVIFDSLMWRCTSYYVNLISHSVYLNQLLSLLYNYFNLYRRFPVTKYPSKYIVLLDCDHWRVKLALKSKFDLLQPRSDVDKYNKEFL